MSIQGVEDRGYNAADQVDRVPVLEAAGSVHSSDGCASGPYGEVYPDIARDRLIGSRAYSDEAAT